VNQSTPIQRFNGLASGLEPRNFPMLNGCVMSSSSLGAAVGSPRSDGQADPRRASKQKPGAWPGCKLHTQSASCDACARVP